MLTPKTHRKVAQSLLQVQSDISQAADNLKQIGMFMGDIHDRISQLQMMLEATGMSATRYKPKHFSLEELVHPSFIRNLNPHLIWGLLDGRILMSADQIRHKFGPTYINTWSGALQGVFGETFSLSGLRPFDTNIGATFSPHKYGTGLDLKFTETTAEEVIRYICQNSEEFPLISRIEVTHNNGEIPTWVHIDCNNTCDYEQDGLIQMYL